MNIVIVGGGIIGIVASILLQSKNHKVTLIEKSNQLGGLLNSIPTNDGNYLDFGSHVPRETGIETLDNILFKDLPKNDWNKYQFANVGNYFANKINSDSQFIDVSELSSEIFIKGLSDLLLCNKQGNLELNNEEASLYNQFGQTYGMEVYKPLLTKLFGNINLIDLEPNSHNLFGYSRLIVGNQQFTDKLKEVPYLDNRIAHTKNSIGYSNKSNYYPKKPGIYQWIEHLKKSALDSGVVILTEDFVIKLNLNDKYIFTNKGNKLNYDKVLWTLPKGLLENIIAEQSQITESLEFRGVNIFHLKYDGELQVKNHYVYCNDTNMKSFRVTLYDNLTQTTTNWCTVEVIGDRMVEITKIFDELKIMGILDKKSKLKDSQLIYIKNGFPIPKKKEANSRSDLSKLNDEIIILNKDANNFFMEDLIVKMFNEITLRNLI